MNKMNRLEEYEQILNELEQPVPELTTSLERAGKRRQRKIYIYRPLTAMAASFLLFIVLVNFSTPVAQACSQIPLLKELAEAVTFSRSLSDAVENEYVQEINLKQHNKEVEATIEYLIVDQKQINIFYRLKSNMYNYIYAKPEILDAETGEKLRCSTLWNIGNGATNGELQQITADFLEQDVPNRIKLQFKVVHYPNMEIEDRENDAHIFDVENVIGEFDFILSFDPTFTDAGKQIIMNQTVELDGQKITISTIEIYPSHIRFNVEADPSNTAWLKGLDYQILLNDSDIFEPVSNGISATGSAETPEMSSFRTDSSYFYDADQLTLEITGAEWLRKGQEKAYINLKTGMTENLPDGVTLYEVTEERGHTRIHIRVPVIKEGHYYSIFHHTFYDKDGKEYIGSGFGTEEALDGEDFFTQGMELTDFHEEEVWIPLRLSHRWEAEEPIQVTVDVN